MLSHGEQTMMDIWNSAGSVGTQQQLFDARSALRRPLVDPSSNASEQASYTRTAQTEIYNLFPRLPNPDLVLYVYPHLSGSEQAPVPGYSTVFPLYRTVQYAQPGERVDDL
ncbi:signal recognition particle gtpase [Pseudomonas sp. M47T1]|nr:signal recognition particle gtpase [Pseudomonas sp. M47T1]